MSLVALIAPDMIDSFPRVSGDEPIVTFQEFADARFSPRERG